MKMKQEVYSHEIPTPNKLNDKEQSARRLEARVQPHKEGMVGGGLEHMLLCLHPIDVLVVCYQRLLDHLHCIHAFCALQFYHQDLEGDEIINTNVKSWSVI